MHNATFAATLWSPDRSPALRFAVLAGLGSLLLAISAKIQVPFWPVPMTMQTYVVLALAAAYGWRLGAATVALYLAQGFAGLPVFAGAAAGPAYMMGPTAGYLVGFLAAAFIVGWLSERGWDRSITAMLVAMTVGHLVIFIFGWSWLATLIGPEKAYVAGVAPFFAATVLKTLLAAATLPALWSLIGRR